ncbi:MAG: hypothetical protein V3U18_05240 [Alphaproteobacteria bacterium]
MVGTFDCQCTTLPRGDRALARSSNHVSGHETAGQTGLFRQMDVLREKLIME